SKFSVPNASFPSRARTPAAVAPVDTPIFHAVLMNSAWVYEGHGRTFLAGCTPSVVSVLRRMLISVEGTSRPEYSEYFLLAAAKALLFRMLKVLG
ncbi:hypothetical protein LTR74_018041, partial [Friedmanniomyces endolithicus]